MIKYLKYGWPSLVVAIAIFYLSCLISPDEIPDSNIEHADKVVHFLMYFGLSFITSAYYIWLNKGDVKLTKMIIFAILIPIIYGGAIEILQDYYFERSADWFDFVADMAGSLTAIPAALCFRTLIVNYEK